MVSEAERERRRFCAKYQYELRKLGSTSTRMLPRGANQTARLLGERGAPPPRPPP